ncbi:hypothetical protein ABBQ38_009025 [Trebouxia sp. C0009 RCD-2024]
MFKSEGRVRELFRKYGKTALATHLTVYGVTFAGLYFAIENKLGPQSLLIKYGLLSDKQVKDEANPQERGWFNNLLSGPSSSIALAFLCNKALLPVRAPITLGLTPMVARALHQRAATAATAAASKQSSAPVSSTPTASQAKTPYVKDKAAK